MTSEQLKNSILQFAVQGKLVLQNPHDEPASELLKKIKVKKEKLIKEKVIKKDKPLLPIKEEDKPFEIPESWEWCRLGDIVNKLTDGTHYTPKYTETGIPFLSVKDMSSGKLDFRSTKHISPEEHKVLYSRCNPEKGDLLLTKVGTTGIPIIVDTDKEFSLFVSVALIKFNNKLINSSFLVHLINSPLVQSQCTNATKGVGNKNWVMRDIANTIISIPPLAEQQLIVDKIEELMPYVEQYGTAESELRKLNTKFPEQLKKSVLQYAVQGKLVPQNIKDEPAFILLEKIKTEKKQLVKEKKIKQDKPLPVIKEDEIPFEIPDSWVWVRLGDLGIIQTGTTPSTQCPEYFGNEIPFIKPADISFGGINYFNEGLTILGSKKSRVIEKNSVLMVCIGGSIGKNYFNDRDVCCNQQINAITPFLLNNNYLFYVLCSDYFYQSLLSKATGTATPIINKSTWSELIIPLPPLSEQKLIVEKVEEVLSYCDKLK